MQGWIKIYREILNKPIWLLSTPEQKTILITILLMVNHEENEWEWKGERYICQPGQMITSLDKITKKAGKGISVQNVRTALLRFEKYSFLTNESTNSNRLITICNWEDYQSKETESNIDANNQLTGDQQAPNNQLTPNKNDKNIKNNKEDILQSNDCPPEEKEVVEEKKKKKSTGKKKIEPSDKDTQLNSEARKIFEARYIRETSEKYYWTGKDGGNMTNILNALKLQRAEKGLSNENNTEILAALTMFINIAVKDEWIKKNFSVSILFTKFNEIVARAKAEEQERRKQKGGNYGTSRKDTDNGSVSQSSEETSKDYKKRF